MSKYRLTKDKFLSDKEQVELREVMSKIPSRDTLLIEFALATGARAQEILNITLHEFDDDNESVYINGIKGSNDRDIPLEKRLYREVKALAKDDPKGRPFPISYPRLVQIWNEWRPGSKSFHCLRHTFAVDLYKRTQDIRLVQIALGHRNIANTMIYVDFLYSKKQMRRLMHSK